MKKIIYLLLAITLIACSSEVEKSIVVKPLATIDFKPSKTGWKSPSSSTTSITGHLSALDIVKLTTSLRLKTIDGNEGTRGFDKAQRDTTETNPKLSMWATDIINSNGEYVSEFIESKDFILEHWHTNSAYSIKDTIAYIPNSVLIAAKIAIKAAYDAKDSETVYRLFNEAFTFLPITGAEYRELKKQGLN